jgi:ABC-type metal ion transport system substrate-binding protein
MNFQHTTFLKNEIVKKKNRTLQEFARTMLYEYPLPKYL